MKVSFIYVLTRSFDMDTNKFDSYTTTATITKFLVDIQDYIGKDKLIIYSNPVGFKNKKNEQANTSQREACQRSQEKKGVRTRIYTAFQDLCSISPMMVWFGVYAGKGFHLVYFQHRS